MTMGNPIHLKILGGVAVLALGFVGYQAVPHGGAIFGNADSAPVKPAEPAINATPVVLRRDPFASLSQAHPAASESKPPAEKSASVGRSSASTDTEVQSPMLPGTLPRSFLNPVDQQPIGQAASNQIPVSQANDRKPSNDTSLSLQGLLEVEGKVAIIAINSQPGAPYRVGDLVSGAKLQGISASSVRLVKNGRTFNLTLGAVQKI